MKNLYRLVDANINRVSEGFRVLEDISRFHFENSVLTEEIKKMRHKTRKLLADEQYLFLEKRNSNNDLGLKISQKDTLDHKPDLESLISANFKRVQEGLRVLEENLKPLGFSEISKEYEKLRFAAYQLEKTYLRLLGKIKKQVLLNTDLYCLTSQEHSLGRSNIDVVKEMVTAGIKIIQYREKDKSLLEKYTECKIIRELTREAGVTFIVNDDIAVAVLVDADGVHIGQDDLPITEVRKLIGEEKIIGVSTHSPEQAQNAIADGADYIGVGPIFKTFTKKDVCEPVGLEYLQYAVEHIKIPFVAIGGIKEHNISQVIGQGASCVCLVTEVVGASDIKEKITSIRSKIKNC